MQKLLFFYLFITLLFFQSSVFAEESRYDTYEDSCMKLYGLLDIPKQGSALFLLRRCIHTLEAKDDQSEDFERMLQRNDQYFWKRYEYGQQFLRESRRSLQVRLKSQEYVRTSYYRLLNEQNREDFQRFYRYEIRRDIRRKEVLP